MATPIADPQRRWTAAELRRLPAEERDAILAAAAAVAAEEYCNDPALGGDRVLAVDRQLQDSGRFRSLSRGISKGQFRPPGPQPACGAVSPARGRQQEDLGCHRP